MPPVIWTVGHSSRAIEEFLELLSSHDIELLADVRRHAGSRTFPHFNPEPLEDALSRAGIAYRHFPKLGGRRKASPDSSNTIWRNASFRGYADYMQTAAFEEGYDGLVEAAQRQRTAIVCSEAVWWRCHRSMIADALKADDVEVRHIMGTDRATEHPFTSPAKLVEGKLTYGPAPDEDL